MRKMTTFYEQGFFFSFSMLQFTRWSTAYLQLTIEQHFSIGAFTIEMLIDVDTSDVQNN